jgi:hypothetical protein
MENLVFGRQAMISESAIADNDSKDKEVSDADLADVRRKNMGSSMEQLIYRHTSTLGFIC